MNDMVVGYRYTTVTNAKNQAVEMYADYVVKASGASFVSGFGVQFPFSRARLKQLPAKNLRAVTSNKTPTAPKLRKAKRLLYRLIITRLL